MTLKLKLVLMLMLMRRSGRGAVIMVRALRRPDTAAVLSGALLFVMVFLLWDPLARIEPPYSTALHAAGGELLGATVAADGQWRFPPGAAVPARFATALVAYEDRRFRGHTGFDSIGILRAIRDNLAGGRIVSGASTISMQLARISAGPRPRSLAAKLLETWIAVRLELLGTKAAILARYAALAPFGGNVVGVQAAGFRWFGHASSQLTWSEAAVLAVLPNSPGLVHPGRSRQELGRKRDALLAELVARGQMDPAELPYALAEALPAEPLPMPQLAPHLLARAGRGQVLTTIDFALQSKALAIAERHAVRLQARGIANLAALILRVADGTVLAHIGNVRSAGEAGAWQVDCAVAPRSSGSILKPFLYAAMLDAGELTPDRLVPDIPTRIGSYSPENFSRSYAGAVRADAALARSLNVPFVRLLRVYGIDRFSDLLRRFGFTTLVRPSADYGLTLILGGAEVTLLDAASAYGLLARSILASQLPSQVASNDRSVNRLLPVSAAAAWLTLEALVHVARPGEDAAWQDYASSRRIAWKTGTSFGNRDAWAIGVTPGYVVAVWAGNADGTGRPEIKGTEAAAPLLFDLFQLLPRSSWFTEPVGELTYITTCAHSGYAAGPDCALTRRVLVPVQAHVDEPCPYCRTVQLSADGRWQVRAECAGGMDMVATRRFVLTPTIEWYYQRSTIGYSPLPPWLPGCAPAGADALDFIQPEAGSLIYIPVELDGSPGLTVFRAVHRDAAARLFWHLDGDYLGETRGDHRMAARPEPGPHELTIVDLAGATATRRFQVLLKDD
jgi:penicillin-binding protein 1C